MAQMNREEAIDAVSIMSEVTDPERVLAALEDYFDLVGLVAAPGIDDPYSQIVRNAEEEFTDSQWECFVARAEGAGMLNRTLAGEAQRLHESPAYVVGPNVAGASAAAIEEALHEAFGSAEAWALAYDADAYGALETLGHYLPERC